MWQVNIYFSEGFYVVQSTIPANIYLFKFNNKTRKRYEICSKLTIKTQERRRSGVFIFNFEHISHLFLVFLLLTLSMYLFAEIKPC